MTGSEQRTGVKTVAVGPDRARQRLDNFLMAQLPGVPRSLVYRIIRTGQVRVNGKRCKPFQKLRAGDQVRIPPVRTDEKETVRVPDAVVAVIEDGIVHQEDGWLACNKPAGIAVHAGSGLGWGLIDALRQSRPGEDLELVHRLDRETSGLLLVARNREALRHLQGQFVARETSKRYLALLDGILPAPRLVVTEALGRQQVSGERMVVVDPEGKPAETVFSEVQRYEGCTLAEVEPVTGRTHQIRVHAAHIGAPCAGDPKYAERDRQRFWRERGLERLFLHAHRLEFTDATGERQMLSSPLPPELRRVLDRLETA